MNRPKYAPDTSETRVQKQNHYTVTPIDSIEHWRKEREQIEAQYHTEKLARFEKARTSAMAIVSGDKQVELLSVMDKAEIAYVKSREEAKAPTPITWEMIQAKKSDWDAKNESVKTCVGLMGYYPDQEIKLNNLSLFQQLKSAIIKFYKDAFPQ